MMPGVRTLDVSPTDAQYTVLVETVSPKFRPCCLLYDPVANGTKRQVFRDLPSHGKFVDVWLKRRRQRCKQCGATIYEDIDCLHDGRRMTTRLFDRIAHEAQQRTFADVGRLYGIPEATVRSVFSEHTDTMLKGYEFETPRVLGIDEKFLMGGYRCVVGNVEKRTLLDMMSNRYKKDLDAYLDAMTDKGVVEVVCQDMYDNYRTLARKHFPHAEIVVDKFHVVKMANEAVEAFRRTLNRDIDAADRVKLKNQRKILLARYYTTEGRTREKLEGWLERYPALADVYWLKERFYDMYDAADAGDAERRYRRWLGLVKPEYEPFFKPIPTAMKKWSKHVLAHFEHPYTNAYVESLNRLIDDMNRAGRGYSFEVLRAKALLAWGAHKVEYPKFRRDPRTFDLVEVEYPSGDFGIGGPGGDDFGASISTLRAWIAKGDFLG